MSSLHHNRSFRRLRPLLVLGKCVSFAVIALLLCLGWLGVSYLKNHTANRRALLTPTPVSANSTSSPVTRLSASATSEAAPAGVRRLVYSCATDRRFYHDSHHVQAKQGRTALSEEAAVSRGLKPCARCFAK